MTCSILVEPTIPFWVNICQHYPGVWCTKHQHSQVVWSLDMSWPTLKPHGDRCNGGKRNWMQPDGGGVPVAPNGNGMTKYTTRYKILQVYTVNIQYIHSTHLYTYKNKSRFNPCGLTIGRHQFHHRGVESVDEAHATPGYRVTPFLGKKTSAGSQQASGNQTLPIDAGGFLRISHSMWPVICWW